MKKRRLVILGAGASYAVGLPDAARAMGHFFMYVRGPFPLVVNRTPMWHFGDLGDALIVYARDAGFRTGDRFPFESMAEAFYKAVEQYATGPAEDFEAAFERFRLFFVAIREYLYSRSCDCAQGYAAFADALRPGDIVITFNWDVCLEIALFLKSKPARVSFSSIRDNEITIIKPHGSVDFCAAEIPEAKMRDAVYLEFIHLALPVAVAKGRVLAPQLVRIRTYDCPYDIEISWNRKTREVNIKIDERKRPFMSQDSDVGPLHLEKLIREPSPFLLTPGSHREFYDWSYSRLLHMVQEISAEIGTVIVCGYSFPDYDHAVIDALAETMRAIGSVPTHIVDPSASHLPKAKLDRIFEKYELHEQGFTEFNWSAL